MSQLDGVRVLEISHPHTMLAGRLLADLGADVITIEPPAGAPGRRLGPFLGNIPGLDRSLAWEALNYGKRAITLDLSDPDGRHVAAHLMQGFDIVLCDRGGLPAELPTEDFPAQVRIVTRPFSESGPKARWRHTDLTLMAAGGAPSVAGEPDRAPLFFPVPQAMMEVGAEAAIAALVGLAARERDGLGQTGGASARIAGMAGALAGIVQGFTGQPPAKRTHVPGGSVSGVAWARTLFECPDGYVMFQILFTGHFLSMAMKVIRWLVDEGALGEEELAFDWSCYGPKSTTEAPPPEPIARLNAAVADLCAARSKFAVSEAARRYGFMAVPVMTMGEIARYEQYAERGLLVEVAAGPAREPMLVPARFVQLSSDPIEILRPAPRLSEHTVEVLGQETDLSGAEIEALFAHGVI